MGELGPFGLEYHIGKMRGIIPGDMFLPLYEQAGRLKSPTLYTLEHKKEENKIVLHAAGAETQQDLADKLGISEDLLISGGNLHIVNGILVLDGFSSVPGATHIDVAMLYGRMLVPALNKKFKKYSHDIKGYMVCIDMIQLSEFWKKLEDPDFEGVRSVYESSPEYISAVGRSAFG